MHMYDPTSRCHAAAQARCSAFSVCVHGSELLTKAAKGHLAPDSSKTHSRVTEHDTELTPLLIHLPTGRSSFQADTE